MIRAQELAFVVISATLAFGLLTRGQSRGADCEPGEHGETASSDAPAPAHLPYLDGVRALAALWVFLAHVGFWGGWPWLPSPKIAVDVFMVHSGYLMVHHARCRPSTARDFWIRRFFRVSPGYWLSLILVFALGAWMLQGYSSLRSLSPELWSEDVIYDPWAIHFTVTNFLVHLTYIFGLIPSYSFSTMLPDWSISLEMQFYAAFPLLDKLLRRSWGPMGFGVLAVASILVTVWSNSLPGPYTEQSGLFPEPSALPLKLTYFLIGMLVAHSVASGHAWQSVLAFVLSWWAMVESHTVIVPALVAYLTVLGFATPVGLARRAASAVLGNRAMKWGAQVSYGVYLYHGFALALVGGWLVQQPTILALTPPMRVLALSVVLIPIVLVIADLLYRVVERPGIELGKRIIAARPQVCVAAAAQS